MRKDKNSVQKYIMEAAAVNDRGLVLPGHLAAMQTVFQNGPHKMVISAISERKHDTLIERVGWGWRCRGMGCSRTCTTSKHASQDLNGDKKAATL